MVDWSASNAPSTPRARDSIWIAEGTAPASHHRTRAAAAAHLVARLEDHVIQGRRALLGFDFGFGYPTGALPAAPAGVALWEWMADRVVDSARNENNRFEVAETLNAGRDTTLFWGRMHQWDGTRYPGLPKRRPEVASRCFRAVEQHLRELKGPGRAVKSCAHVAGAAGTVGSQIIMGLPTLARLKAQFGAHLGCWPFEPDALAAPLVLAEIYPSLLDGPVRARMSAAPRGTVKDAVQVESMAAAVLALQRRGDLARAFAVPRDYTEPAQVEGWILGATDPHCLEAAMTDIPTPTAPPPLRNDCFALPPGIHWTPVDTALEHLRAGLTCVTAPETVPIEDSCGRILAAPVVALRDNPPTANAAVDGYGFACADAALRMQLVVGRAAAGVPYPGRVPAGQAVRILTGAPLPEGVDTVVMQEDTTQEAGALYVAALPKAGANTRRAGEDKKVGAALFDAGHVLRAPDLATLSALGHGTVSVRRRLRVGVLSTGDELAAPGSPVTPAQIYDANGPMLRSMIAGWGMEAVPLGRAPDDRDALRRLLNAAIPRCDAILTSGGASGGDEDHMSALLTSEGQHTLWRIAVKPGRPLALGIWQGVPLFGLPGNPVAAFVTAAIFARPALGLLGGAGWCLPEALWLPACFEKSKKSGRREFLRARITAHGVEAYGSEGSGRVSGLSWADALIDLPEDALDVQHGDVVRVLPYAALLNL
jgi:molybdopterin molybdotransferase